MLVRSKRALLFDDAGYLARLKTLFGSSIIGYWPMNEPSGAVALDYSGNGFHGAYTAVTLGQPGIGDGQTCPLFDGSASYVQLPAGFRTAFTPLEFSILVWLKIASAVWTDGSNDVAVHIGVNGSTDFTRIMKGSAGNNIQGSYVAGGTTKTQTVAFSFTDWFLAALTVSKSADQLKFYLQGAQGGATLTSLGVWSGTPAAATTVIGAQTATPALPLNGYGAHVCVINRAATSAEVAAAANI